MKTIEVVEALLERFQNQNFYNTMLLTGVIDEDERPLIAKEHLHLKNIIKNFNRPLILATVNRTITIFIIEKKGSKNHVLIINGPDCEYKFISKGLLIKTIAKSYDDKEFSPEVFVEKLLVVEWVENSSGEKIFDFSERFVEGEIISKVGKNLWSPDINTWDVKNIKVKEMKLTDILKFLL